MSTATIRRARLADVDAALALWALLQDEHEALDARLRRSASAARRWETDFTVWLSSDADAVFVAERDGAVVGLLTVHAYWPAPVYEERLDAYVTELVVAPEARGQGIGRALVAAARAWAERLGAARLRAGVLAAHPEARRFWARVGATDFVVTVTLDVAGRSPE